MTEKTAVKVTYNYLGQNREGLIRLRSAKEELLVSGTLYAVSKPKNPTAGKTKVALVTLKTSPSYSKAESDQQFGVVTSTGERLRVVGKVVSKTTTFSVSKKQVLVQRPKAETTLAVPEPTSKKIRCGKKPSADVSLNEETLRVNELLKLGHDPEVRMKYVSYFIGQSEGNLYKKIKAGTFPAPHTKPGGGAHWKHSTLLDYQAQTAEPKARRTKKKV
jgi:predicted DNA-binding transcriptional regulator AlpA